MRQSSSWNMSSPSGSPALGSVYNIDQSSSWNSSARLSFYPVYQSRACIRPAVILMISVQPVYQSLTLNVISLTDHSARRSVQPVYQSLTLNVISLTDHSARRSVQPVYQALTLNVISLTDHSARRSVQPMCQSRP
ncbi:hypothetical protein RRG08_043810 [Elysia crispata]|uniref:Uncharacterized protein n=1 Tax=Elysia crispata TaxID=231223 RepID=A0AAE1DAW4_9GAST|nr:hypothetical protein RRG08_043810 [Elysia crispata]